MVVVPPGHSWWQLEEIPAEEFALTPLVQRDPWSNSSRIVTATLERLGYERIPPTAAIGSTAGVIAMAQAEGMPALVSIMAARAQPEQHLEIRRVEGLRFGLEYALVWAGPMLDLRAEVQAVAGHIMHLPFARPRASPPAASNLPTPTPMPAPDPAPQSAPPPAQQAAPQPPQQTDLMPSPDGVPNPAAAPQQTASQSIQRPAT